MSCATTVEEAGHGVHPGQTRWGVGNAGGRLVQARFGCLDQGRRRPRLPWSCGPSWSPASSWRRSCPTPPPPCSSWAAGRRGRGGLEARSGRCVHRSGPSRLRVTPRKSAFSNEAPGGRTGNCGRPCSPHPSMPARHRCGCWEKACGAGALNAVPCCSRTRDRTARYCDTAGRSRHWRRDQPSFMCAYSASCARTCSGLALARATIARSRRLTSAASHVFVRSSRGGNAEYRLGGAGPAGMSEVRPGNPG